MSAAVDLGRVLTAMVTPFHPDGSLDVGRAEELANLLVENGNDGVVVGGTTGESPTLNHDEKLELYRAVRGAIPNAVVIMGAGTYDTAASIELARDAQNLDADCVLAVVPYYNKPPQKSLLAHFKAIAGAVDVPVMVYNVPSRTASNLAAETTIELSHVSNIVALKEASPNMVQVATEAAGVAADFRIYSGDDSLTLPMLSLGAYGVVSVAGHFAGKGIQELIAAHGQGRVEEAARLQYRLLPIFEEVFCTTSPVPTKALLREIGFEVGGTRLPLDMSEITDSQVESLKQVYADLGEFALTLPVPASTTA
ncbi:MAG TPA: 4-hydroxy-tetrahydrodipicolinate synthase [Candidatus Solibacter sp.]|jgi:4-hydroxy-tetrahydrodipicolinate synthase|nr:4-hydroxy-tetrahydrodipicolinate synthase [Candidatus Solibacter sp.]